jgi:hypothetical protein
MVDDTIGNRTHDLPTFSAVSYIVSEDRTRFSAVPPFRVTADSVATAAVLIRYECGSTRLSLMHRQLIFLYQKDKPIYCGAGSRAARGNIIGVMPNRLNNREILVHA